LTKTFFLKLQTTISNNLRLIDDGNNYLMEWNMDNKQENTKASREALAYKDNWLYLIVVQNATMFDLAIVLKEMKVDYALNLDGGYSQALFYNDEYMVGPGRDVPNAVLFATE
jgi:exopolysaccharide biosynthesis protein